LALDHPNDETRQPFLELPEYAASGGRGHYTGFNSVELQEVYAVRTQAAVRSQISPRGGHKPCMALFPNGDLLATQKANGQHIALCRFRDKGLSWEPPREVVISGQQLSGRAAMFSALADGTLLLGGAAGTIYRSSDEGHTWQECRIDRSVTVAGTTYEIDWGENSGPHQLSNGTVICSGYISFEPGHTQAYLLRSTDGGQTWGDPSCIATGSEVNLEVLPSDKLFACLRVATDGAGEGGAVVAVTESADGGAHLEPAEQDRRAGPGPDPGLPAVSRRRQAPDSLRQPAVPLRGAGDRQQGWRRN